eukprot:3923358-Rhodomonas_salina.1
MGSGPLPLLFQLDAHHSKSYRPGGHSFAVDANFGGVREWCWTLDLSLKKARWGKKGSTQDS